MKTVTVQGSSLFGEVEEGNGKIVYQIAVLVESLAFLHISEIAEVTGM